MLSIISKFLDSEEKGDKEEKKEKEEEEKRGGKENGILWTSSLKTGRNKKIMLTIRKQTENNSFEIIEKDELKYFLEIQDCK